MDSNGPRAYTPSMVRQDRTPNDWTAATRPGSQSPLVAAVSASPLGGFLRLCRWVIACLLSVIILPTYFITIAVCLVIFSPLIVIAIRKGRIQRIIHDFPWFPPGLARMLIPPGGATLRRLAYLVTRNR